jgi:hypothetical protein
MGIAGRGFWWTVAGAASVVMVVGCGRGAHSAPPTSRPTTAGTASGAGLNGTEGSVAPATTVAATAACSLPLTHALDDGFHIAVPSGWGLSTLNGQAIVAKTPTQTEAVLVYPALLTKGLTPSSFFNAYSNKLDQANAAAGTPVSGHIVSGSDGLPAADFTQTVDGLSLQGHATVRVLPLDAPGATQEAVYISYWAPATEYAGARAELASIATCYGPEPATPSRVFQDQVFTYAVPPGWRAFDENSNGIDLHGPDNSDVSYILDGPVQTSQFDSPQTMVAWFLRGVGITGVTSLASSASPTSQASNGGTESDLYELFDGQSGSSPVRGLIFSDTEVGGGVATGYIRMAVAPANNWNSLNGSMLQIAGSIQHNFNQDLANLAQVNQQWQDFSGQVADFDDTLNNQQLTQDPATGFYYEAPYTAYDVNGANGPGYYLDNGDRLNEISRS